MRKYIFAFLLCPTLLWGQHIERNLNDNWLFTAEDVIGGAHPKCDVSSWKKVTIPFDYSMEGEYSPENSPQNGFLPIANCWFRKAFEYQPEKNRERMYIWFDGAYMDSEVYVNGQLAGHRPYGFISFYYDITHLLKKGKNLVCVRIKNADGPTARFYHPSSIYGDVQLVSVPEVHIPISGGVFYHVVAADKNEAKISLKTEVRNMSRSDASVSIQQKLYDRQGNEVASSVSKSMNVVTLEENTDHSFITVKNPKLWNLDQPYLYRLETSVLSNGKLIDKTSTKVGIRTIDVKKETGFYLNGESIKLQGMCEHMEMLPVGFAIPEDMWRKRILMLKSMGCNTIRTAHNPFPPVFYELCDELGMLVIDEIFDGWRQKGANDYAGRFFSEWWKRDVKDWVRRDRNHPSIVMWSVGNETGSTDIHNITGEIHRYDGNSRPTSGGGVLWGTDISGFTGQGGKPGTLEKFHQENPDRAIVLLEKPHTIQTRGFYRVPTWWRDKGEAVNEYKPYGTKQIFFDGRPRYRSSYDNCAVRMTARQSWKRTKNTPWIIGEFRWTGYECFGEAQFMGSEFPKRSYNAGIIDLAGFPKDHYYFYKSQWTKEPMVHILPHWTHPDLKHGTIIPVVVYSNCEQVELFLNGRSLGKQKPGELLDFVWKVPYSPGKLKAIGYNKGKKCAEMIHKTASDPCRLSLTVDTKFSQNADSKVSYLNVTATDAKGNFVPWACNKIKFHVTGNTRILGFENGNPIDDTHHKACERTLFYGLARGFFQNTHGEDHVQVTAAVILGDTLFSDKTKVAIHASALALRGEIDKNKYDIYYTTDGSKPSVRSTRYSKPLTICETTTVKAVVVSKGKEILSLEEKFTKGEVKPFVDPMLRTDDVLKGKFTGPFDKELVGRWTCKETGQIFLFDNYGSLIQFVGDGYTPKLIGEWWYDYPDDKFENPDAVGVGEIRLNKDKETVSIKLTQGDDDSLIIHDKMKLIRQK